MKSFGALFKFIESRNLFNNLSLGIVFKSFKPIFTKRFINASFFSSFAKKPSIFLQSCLFK